jgi:hypothetical protein
MPALPAGFFMSGKERSMTYIIDRMLEKSTWTGLIKLAGSLGIITLTQEQGTAIVAAAVAAVAVVQIFLREKSVGA